MLTAIVKQLLLFFHLLLLNLELLHLLLLEDTWSDLFEFLLAVQVYELFHWLLNFGVIRMLEQHFYTHFFINSRFNDTFNLNFMIFFTQEFL